LQVRSIHAVISSSLGAEPLQQVARNTPFAYHVWITVDRAEDMAKQR
jgi:hypothetical protein